MFYVFYGDDEFSRAEALADFRARMGDPITADLNTTYLDGRKVTFSELTYFCDAVPFMAQVRLVIVEGLLTRLTGRRSRDGKAQISGRDQEFLEALLTYLPRLPETTRLAFVEAESLTARHPVLKLAQEEKRGHAREFRAPDERSGSLERWIQDRAGKKGGEIAPRAAHELASFVGNNLRLLDRELEKLAVYVGDRGTIGVDDVRRLVPYVHEANIFEMTDALGRRDGPRASRLLHLMLDGGNDPLYLLGMIVRQFRIMIQVKDLAERGVHPNDIPSRLDMKPFVARKGLDQAARFSMSQLETIYRRLWETDLAIKTGQTEPVLALDVLVAGLCGSRTF
ncbi:MAG: DNA polymerase III subunit delta [Anaerolineae bacterium]|nr:MAG: DNA polymerase III subunit delta [Anaerolineae bacterium]